MLSGFPVHELTSTSTLFIPTLSDFAMKELYPPFSLHLSRILFIIPSFNGYSSSTLSSSSLLFPPSSYLCQLPSICLEYSLSCLFYQLLSIHPSSFSTYSSSSPLLPSPLLFSTIPYLRQLALTCLKYSQSSSFFYSFALFPCLLLLLLRFSTFFTSSPRSSPLFTFHLARIVAILFILSLLFRSSYRLTSHTFPLLHSSLYLSVSW